MENNKNNNKADTLDGYPVTSLVQTIVDSKVSMRQPQHNFRSSNACVLSIMESLNFFKKKHIPYCDENSKYKKIIIIGRGSYGTVFQAYCQDNKKKKQFVAMKNISITQKTGSFDKTTMRELLILRSLKHENVINFREMFSDKKSDDYDSKFYIVMDFCEHDLGGLLINKNVKFSLGEIKDVMKQLFKGLNYIHNKNILHRDMKPANVLITKTGVLKIADFGLARKLTKPEKDTKNCYTNKVVTLWYRAPELLLGDREYGLAVDIWSVGCIMAEMWIRTPIMKGKSEKEQLDLISELCGSFTPDVWPGLNKLNLYNSIEFQKTQKRKVQEMLIPFVRDKHACELIDKLLILDPQQRIDTYEALDHDFFSTDPQPSNLYNTLSQLVENCYSYFARRINTN